ncbi:hypothetical protein [Sphingomonas oryzagri]|uniref:Uncharacterized protein n=1 Tax=Sphingomonas oryzagri TaxID=3042314 RepID=A0ABT6MZK3_9SPHN|nr:hypothetical protein [Sphingomonas oryzagri]MDH7638491.1 hypothetical protein [Sphingomonas oryzagri]
MMDSLYFLLIVFVVAVVASVSGYCLGRLRPSWSRHRLAMLSALPLPLLGCLSSVVVIVDAANAPRERCGVDACGMATAAGMFGIMLSAVMFVIGYVAVFLSQSWLSRL